MNFAEEKLLMFRVSVAIGISLIKMMMFTQQTQNQPKQTACMTY